MRNLHWAARFRFIDCRPVLRLTKQEVSIRYSGGTAASLLRRVSAREFHLSSILIAPLCGVVLENQKLTAEVQNVLTHNEGNHIRRVVRMFLIYRIDLIAGR